MEVSWLPKEKPVTWHQTTSQPYLDVPAAPHEKDAKDSSSWSGYRPCNAAPHRKRLPVVAVLAAVSAVLFLAYLCSLSVRGRLSTRLFGRKLAGGEDGKENNETDPCVPHSDTDVEAFPGTPEQPSEGRIPSAHGQALPAASWSGESETAYRIALSLMGATAAPVEDLYRAARPHLGPAEEKRGEKRKESETDGVGRGAKVQKLEAPIHHSLLGPSVPQLYPDRDSLIDLTLSEGVPVLGEDSWLLDDDIAYRTPSRLENENTTPAEMYVGQQSHHAPTRTSRRPPPLPSGNLSTLDSSGSPAMRPLSVFESVLSEPSQSSVGLRPDDWLLNGDAEVVDKALDLIDLGTKPSMLLGSRGDSQKGEGSRAKAATEDQIYGGAASSSRSIRDSLMEAIQEPAEILLGIPSASTDPKHAGAVGVLESPVLRSLLSSSSTGSIQPSSSKGSEDSLQEPAAIPPAIPSTSTDPEQGGEGGIVGSPLLRTLLSSSSTGSIQHSSTKGSEDPLQVLASQAQAAADNLVASRGWLEAMLRDVSEPLLRTHPFYRLPEVEPLLSGRRFNNIRAEERRPQERRLIRVLSECRQLMKKERLTSSELEVLQMGRVEKRRL